MNQLQLIENIVSAAEAAKPAQEYCFLWINHWSTCMTKGEWSGWMQAVGSVIALAVALSIPYLQKRIERRDNFAMAANCLRLHVSLYTAIQGVASTGKTNKEALLSGKDAIALTIGAYKSVNSATLPSASLPAWYAAQVRLFDLQNLLNTVGSDDGLGKVIEGYKNLAIESRDLFFELASKKLDKSTKKH